MYLDFVFILLICSTTSAAAVFFVKPTNLENCSCPDEPCQTLDQYAQHSSVYFTSGSTFVFLAGNHTLQNTVSLFNVSNIAFKKWENDITDVVILCKAEVSIFCNATEHLRFQGLTFLLSFDNPNQNSLCVRLIESRNILIANSTFQGVRHLNKNAFCQALLFVRSHADIKDSFFNGNTAYDGGAVHAEETIINLSRNIFVENKAIRGGAMYASGGSLTIYQGNSFSQNSAARGGAIYCINNCILSITANQTGVTFIANSASVGSAIHLLQSSELLLSGRSRIEFRENVAKYDGAGIMIEENSTLISYVENLYFINNTAEMSHGGAILASYNCSVVLGGANMSSNHYFINNSAVVGGAISSVGTLTLGEKGTHYFCNNKAGNDGGAISFGDYVERLNITIKGNSSFKNNSAQDQGGAISLLYSNFLASNVLISNNKGYYGGGIYTFDSNVTFQGNVMLQGNLADADDIIFTEVITGSQGGGIYSKNSSLIFEGPSCFYGNEASRGGAIYAFYGTTILFYNVLQFSHNRAELSGGAINADQTVISTGLSLNFTFNYAHRGGAMYFGSSVTFTPNSLTRLYSANNNATEYGGSIYYDDSSVTSVQCMFPVRGNRREIELLPLCFMQFRNGHNIHFYSSGDYAGKDGSFLYGGLLDRCRMKDPDPSISSYDLLVPYDFLWRRAFHLSVQDNSTRSVTSKPYQLCFCTDDQTYNCSEQKTVRAFRGQTFNLSVLALDQMRNIISTLVTAQVGETATLGFNQNMQTINTEHCTNLTFNFYSTKDEDELILYSGGPCRDIGLAQVIINVTVIPCPDGFIQSREKCICEERLQKYTEVCRTEETAYITREAGSRFWMGALYSTDKHYEGLILYETCPFDYCTQDSINLTLCSLDKQCNVNRGKVLCGACVNNSSLMLGGYQCKVCSNRYLTLLFLFAAAGIVLVIFLSFLRLTVATGMINGVILYANIVQVNKMIFFPGNPQNLFTVFIAWLNLDLGFQTCFYDGMDAYAQTWLQFVFPLYVWILIALIIVTSRYSITVSKLIGSNPIAVLATLILMSYTKVLKIITEVYSSVVLDCPGNKTVRMWLKDANVPYLKSQHLLLTVVTTLILVFLFIPYTLLLLLGHKMYRYSTKKYLHWLIKVKPLLDSYYAPYKIHTRYWTGLLLLVRCGLYIAFSFNSLGGTNKSLLVINIVFVLLVVIAWLSVRIYTSFSLNIMEALIFLNLVVLSASSLAGVSSPPLVYVMVGVVFATMMGIIVYHFHLAYITKSALWLKVKAKMLEKVRQSSEKQEGAVPLTVVTKSAVDLRELLLDNDVTN